MKRETARWFQKAEEDFEGARILARNRPPPRDLICFHCQQAAEKYLKGLLQELGLPVPRIHNLDDLLTLLLPHDPSLGKLSRSLVSLSRYAVDIRYPGKRKTFVENFGHGWVCHRSVLAIALGSASLGEQRAGAVELDSYMHRKPGLFER